MYNIPKSLLKLDLYTQEISVNLALQSELYISLWEGFGKDNRKLKEYESSSPPPPPPPPWRQSLR
ncbi:hypothetical protein SCA6_016913 [Theobroma cacao]